MWNLTPVSLSAEMRAPQATNLESHILAIRVATPGPKALMQWIGSSNLWAIQNNQFPFGE